MISIHLYQPGIVDANVDFPSEWNELLIEEIHLIAQVILLNYENPYEANAAVLLGMLAIRINGKIKRKNGKFIKSIEKELDAEDSFIKIINIIDFIYKGNGLTRQPYPQIKLDDKILQGSADDFNKLTCGEFEDAEFFFNRFKKEPAHALLAGLASILYRPKDVKYLTYKGSTDEYILYESEKMLPVLKKLEPWKLYTMFLWYAGCRDQLPKMFPHCFGGDNASDAQEDFEIFTKCIHAGAGPKNGTRNQIRCTLLKEFFFEIEEEKKNALEIQKQYDNAAK